MKIEVKPDGPVACAVVHRDDGHELSLSSMDHSLIEWGPMGMVEDHGWVSDPLIYISILAKFMAE